MNQRIKELLAELDIDLYTDKGVMMTKILVSPKDLRQFAELIVRECADVVYSRSGHATPQDLYEHFGVEYK